MRSIREMVRSILKDDALYRRKDLPGDLDDPPDHGGCGCEDSCECDDGCGCDCGCSSCAGGEDFVTPKYALYSMIGDAIALYDMMESDSTGNSEIDDMIVSTAHAFRRLRG